MTRWARPLLTISAAGLLASLAINFFARLGTLTHIGRWESVLFVGCIIVSVSGLYVTDLHDKSKELKEYWKLVGAVLDASPVWLRYTIIVLWLYGLFCTSTSLDLSFGTAEATDAARELVGRSGGLIMFYSMSLAMLYSSTDGRFRERRTKSHDGDIGI